jgi:hypothetical protein
MTIALPGWLLEGDYRIDIVSGAARATAPQNIVVPAAVALLTNLAEGARVFVVPPPSWHDGGSGPPDLTTKEPSRLLGVISTAVGWLHEDEVLVYVDLGFDAAEIHRIVVHGAYGQWGIWPPEAMAIAVSTDGLKWTHLGIPALPADATNGTQQAAAFHAGLDGVSAKARYVRVSIRTAWDNSSGFTRWGVVRATSQNVFLTGIEIAGKR